MSIPISTTTITIKGKRPQASVDPDAEGYDVTPVPDDDVLATGVRATITLPSGFRNNADTDEVIGYSLRCDPVNIDVTRFDTVIDEVTEIEYKVASAQHSHPTQFGLDHITARLYLTNGLQSGGGYVVPA